MDSNGHNERWNISQQTTYLGWYNYISQQTTYHGVYMIIEILRFLRRISSIHRTNVITVIHFKKAEIQVEITKKTRKSHQMKAYEKQRKMEELIHTKMEEIVWITWKKVYEEEEW